VDKYFLSTYQQLKVLKKIFAERFICYLKKMPKSKHCHKNTTQDIERTFDVPIKFDQELGATPEGFVPISLNPNIVNPGLTGRLLLKFNKTFTRAQFKLYVFSDNTNPQNFIRVAHLHFGRANVNGPAVVTLFDAPTPSGVFSNGLLSSGIITNADISRVTHNVVSVASLLDSIRRGEIYVNVHTVALPAGAIRGQIFSAETTN